jgi:hypothetical protein
MVILAEISDKMPSAAGIVTASVIASCVGGALAWSHRAAAWVVLSLTLLIGGFFAWAGYHAAFREGSFSDAVWAELGRPWVAASIVGPLLPAVCAACVAFGRRCQRERRGFPLDDLVTR